MTNLRTQTIDPMRPPVGREGMTVGMPVTVEIQTFSEAAELEADPLWQEAPITKRVRPMLLARPFRGTRIRPVITSGGDALVLHFAAPDPAFGKGTVVSASPTRQIMRRQDRILIVWADRVEVIQCGGSVGFAKRRAVDEAAKDLLAHMYSATARANEVRKQVAVERIRRARVRLTASESLLRAAVEAVDEMEPGDPFLGVAIDRFVACARHLEVDRQMLGEICDRLAIEPGMPDDVVVEMLGRRLEVMTPEVWCGLAAAVGAGAFEPVRIEQHVNRLMEGPDELCLYEQVRVAAEMVDAHTNDTAAGFPAGGS